jgi:ligand-binding SRPBCC domain-containing protein
MKSYTHRFQVRAPLERVAEFHREPTTLKRLTPPPLIVQFNELQPLNEGSIADFTMWFGPLPIHWIAVHSDVDPSRGFTDTQVAGPFDQWVHRHSFDSLDEQLTEVSDQIQALPGTGLFRGLVSRVMWLNLPILFAYRAWRTKRALEVSKA